MTDPIDREIRSMVATLVESSPLPPPFPTRPTPGGGRRPWRTVVAVALALAVIATVGYAAATRTSSTRVATGPGRSSADQFIVVDDGSARTTLINSNSGTTRVVELPHRTGGDFPYAILATSGYFVYVGSGGTWATPVDVKGPPRNLGMASYIVPSSTPGRVWLVAGAASGRSALTTAQEVGVDGRYRGPVRSVPTGDAVVTGATEGVVLDTADGTVLWNPSSGRYGATIVGAHRSNLIDVQGSKLAWVGCTTEGACTTAHVADLTTGQSRDYPAPPGTSGWISTGGEGSRDAFSPDGRYLAVRATSVTHGATSSNIYVIDLARKTTSLVAGTSASPYSRSAWLQHERGIVSQHDDGAIQVNDLIDRTIRVFARAPSGVAILTTPA